MRNLLRKPLTWVVAVEFVVMTALFLLVWNLVATAAVHHAATASPLVGAPAPADAAASPVPSVPAAGPPVVRGPLPGLNVSADFWRTRLKQLNGEQVFFEQLQWRVVHSAMEAMRRYVESVVMPAVLNAEHAGRPGLPALGGPPARSAGKATSPL